MMIWYVKLKINLEKTEDSPLHHCQYNLSQVSRSLLHEIVSEKLNFRKSCARWAPKIQNK